MATKAQDLFWMKKCIELAQQAAAIGEVPVGAIVVQEDQMVAQAFNRREMDQSPTAHAEVLAIQEAARNLGRWRLNSCTLYVSLEPCVMCAGAIHQSRIGRLVYAATDPKAGAIESVFRIFDSETLNHHPQIERGPCEHAAASLLSSFFRARRQEKHGSTSHNEETPSSPTKKTTRRTRKAELDL